MLRRRETWFEGQLDLDPERLVFVDETGLSTKMARLRGRAPRGRRCRSGAPCGHWKTTTFAGALRLGGMTAPFALDGPMNGAVFRAGVEQFLAPTLRPGDTVILDNPPAHKVAGVHEATVRAGARLRFLPPYSPDFNPIEMAFARLKALLRARSERTIDTLWDAVGAFIPTFTPTECVNYFAAAGYDRNQAGRALSPQSLHRHPQTDNFGMVPHHGDSLATIAKRRFRFPGSPPGLCDREHR